MIDQIQFKQKKVKIYNKHIKKFFKNKKKKNQIKQIKNIFYNIFKKKTNY